MNLENSSRMGVVFYFLSFFILWDVYSTHRARMCSIYRFLLSRDTVSQGFDKTLRTQRSHYRRDHREYPWIQSRDSRRQDTLMLSTIATSICSSCSRAWFCRESRKMNLKSDSDLYWVTRKKNMTDSHRYHWWKLWEDSCTTWMERCYESIPRTYERISSG